MRRLAQGGRLVLVLTVAAAQVARAQGHAHQDGDTTFRGVQARGAAVMGVDQATSTHQFDLLRDGGRIRLQRDTVDPAGAATIRAHLRDVAAAFSRGDFSSPAMDSMHRLHHPPKKP